MFRRQTFEVWQPYVFDQRFPLIFIYKGIAVLDLKFQFEIKDWEFLTAGSLI